MKFSFSRPKIEHLDRYLAQKEYDKALAAVAAELRTNPRQFALLLRQAEILGLAGNREQAISVYRELAEKYARDGFYAKAIALYKEVLRLAPNLEEVHAELARLIEEDRASREDGEADAELIVEEQPQEKAPVEAAVEEEEEEPEVAPEEETEVAPEEEVDEEDELREAKELKASALFASFREEALEQILTSTSLRGYDEGDIIVTEGEQGSSLFLIVSGEVKVFTLGEIGEHIPLAELGPGDFFGEVSLLTGKPRTATITAKSKVIAIELAKDSVDRIAAEHPEVNEVLQEFYERRAHETVEAVIRRMRAQLGED
jgi:cAMP-dependent protein kinase regulator